MRSLSSTPSLFLIYFPNCDKKKNHPISLCVSGKNDEKKKKKKKEGIYKAICGENNIRVQITSAVKKNIHKNFTC